MKEKAEKSDDEIRWKGELERVSWFYQLIYRAYRLVGLYRYDATSVTDYSENEEKTSCLSFLNCCDTKKESVLEFEQIYKQVVEALKNMKDKTDDGRKLLEKMEKNIKAFVRILSRDVTWFTVCLLSYTYTT